MLGHAPDRFCRRVASNMNQMAVEWQPGARVTATVYGRGDPSLIFAHGAGTDQRHPLVADFAAGMADRGVTTVTFDYPYSSAGRRRPDAAVKLLACHAAVVDSLTGSDLPVLGGRSMGGRMASMLVAGAWDGPRVRASGLVLHAYPLHPAGRPERLRIDHLDDIRVPILAARGSRDALARSDLFDRHLRSRPNVTVHDLDGLDHSFRGAQSARDDLLERLVSEAVRWMEALEA